MEPVGDTVSSAWGWCWGLWPVEEKGIPQAATLLPSAPLCRGRQISSEPGFLFRCNPVFLALLSPSHALFFLSQLWLPFRHLLSPHHCLLPVFLARCALNVCLLEAHFMLVFTSAPRTRFLGLPALRLLSCWIVLVRCKQLRRHSVFLRWGCSVPSAQHAALRLLRLSAAGRADRLQKPGTLPGRRTKRGEAKGGR